jgi:hypothetical protein
MTVYLDQIPTYNPEKVGGFIQQQISKFGQAIENKVRTVIGQPPPPSDRGATVEIEVLNSPLSHRIEDVANKTTRFIYVDGIENDKASEAGSRGCCTKWKALAIISGILFAISLIAIIALFVPPVAVALGLAGSALIGAKAGAIIGALFFGACTLGFGIKAYREAKVRENVYEKIS